MFNYLINQIETFVFFFRLQNVTKPHYGDWKRHLAVMLANRTDANAQFVDLCVRTMGDTLGK